MSKAITPVKALRDPKTGALSIFNDGEVVDAFEWEGRLYPSMGAIQVERNRLAAVDEITTVIIDASVGIYIDWQEFRDRETEWEQLVYVQKQAIDAIVEGLTGQYEKDAPERVTRLRDALVKYAGAL